MCHVGHLAHYVRDFRDPAHKPAVRLGGRDYSLVNFTCIRTVGKFIGPYWRVILVHKRYGIYPGRRIVLRHIGHIPGHVGHIPAGKGKYLANRRFLGGRFRGEFHTFPAGAVVVGHGLLQNGTVFVNKGHVVFSQVFLKGNRVNLGTRDRGNFLVPAAFPHVVILHGGRLGDVVPIMLPYPISIVFKTFTIHIPIGIQD